MSLKKEIRGQIRDFILFGLEKHPRDIVKIAAGHFNISRQAILKYVVKMSEEGLLEISGSKKGIKYGLKVYEKEFVCKVTRELDESEIWRDGILPFLPTLKENVSFICNYGFTEMVNNVKDHSSSNIVYIWAAYDAVWVRFGILDEGIGIFSKIQKDFNLSNKKDAILELAKGKLTSDPENHTGEGIFFTSRLYDDFTILSEDLYFHGHENSDWLLEMESAGNGTAVFMGIKRESSLDPNQIFNKFASPELDDYGFSKTHLPVNLLQHEGEALVSRSQAKRLLARFGQFREVVLDFSGIRRIGQGFADEIFRVFKRNNPQVNLIPINLSENVEQMIKRVLSNAQTPLF